MRWLTLTHTQRWHANRRTSGTGPIYQGRFKSFPVQSDEHPARAMVFAEFLQSLLFSESFSCVDSGIISYTVIIRRQTLGNQPGEEKQRRAAPGCLGSRD